MITTPEPCHFMRGIFSNISLSQIVGLMKNDGVKGTINRKGRIEKFFKRSEVKKDAYLQGVYEFSPTARWLGINSWSFLNRHSPLASMRKICFLETRSISCAIFLGLLTWCMVSTPVSYTHLTLPTIYSV